MTRIAAPPTTRRALLGGLATSLVATACEGGQRPETLPSPGAEPGGTDPVTGPDADPDAALVESVVADVSSVLALVTAAARAHRSLRAALLPWQRMHAAHLAALEATPADGAGVRARGAVSALSARVRREETGLQRRLTDAAAAARSGPVASLLATMSAAVAQQLAASQPGRSS